MVEEAGDQSCPVVKVLLNIVMFCDGLVNCVILKRIWSDTSPTVDESDIQIHQS